MAELHDVLIRPILTEKTTQLWRSRTMSTLSKWAEGEQAPDQGGCRVVFGVTVTDVRTAQHPRQEQAIRSLLRQAFKLEEGIRQAFGW